jgi:hypothetical protein
VRQFEMRARPSEGESDVGGGREDVLFATVPGDGDGRARRGASHRGCGVTAKDWKRKAAEKAAEPLTLPSGMVIRARRPGPLQMMEWNRLPNLPASAGEDGSGLSTEQVVETAAFLRKMLVYCCVAPRISETAAEDAEDEIRPGDLPGEDFMFIMRWALRMKEADAVRPFRGEPKDGGGGGDGEAVRTETVDAAGDCGPGAGAGDRPGGGGAAGGAAAGERGE